MKALQHQGKEDWGQDSQAALAKAPSEMRQLEYFHVKDARPSLSLVADSMQNVGEEQASFVKPRGLYVADAQGSSLYYRADQADYAKARQRLLMRGNVALDHEDSHYFARQAVYYPAQGLMEGEGDVKVTHLMEKTRDRLEVSAQRLRARPKQDWAMLIGGVKGQVLPRQKFRPQVDFASREMELLGPESHIRLEQEVEIRRAGLRVTSQKGDIYLENAHKKLKYLVLNDDVKVTENLVDASGQPMVRKAWAERLEGFGEDRMVLSGAPRVEQGKDMVKGYRITLRERMEFIEVEDAMSDLSVKKDAKEKKAKERR